MWIKDKTSEFLLWRCYSGRKRGDKLKKRTIEVTASNQISLDLVCSHYVSQICFITLSQVSCMFVLTISAKNSCVSIHNSCYFGAHTPLTVLFLEVIISFLEVIIVFLEVNMLKLDGVNCANSALKAVQNGEK